MYTTRPLSLYKNSPEAISSRPEGPNSGFLVLQDEESTPTCCFGLCKNPAIKDLPFPQNKRLSIEYHVHSSEGGYHTYNEVYLIPVINQPLSSNRYYAIKSDWRWKGKAYACSKEEDKVNCLFCIPCIRDEKPRLFDPEDIYQQFEFSVAKNCFNCDMFVAKSIAPNGHPPKYLRRKGWEMNAKSLKNSTLGEAQGLNSSLRAQFPDFNFLSTQECSKSVIGKWYCPFIFIKDGTEKDQIKTSVFYEMTLEQRWERIFAAKKSGDNKGNAVTVDVAVPTEVVKVAGQEATQEDRNDDKGVVWFRTMNKSGAEEQQVGLSSLIIERMMWEEERVGWIKEAKKHIRVVKDEKYDGVGDWTSFGCYLLVESFVLKRNNGSVVLTYDFKHTHQIRTKWE